MEGMKRNIVLASSKVSNDASCNSSKNNFY